MALLSNLSPNDWASALRNTAASGGTQMPGTLKGATVPQMDTGQSVQDNQAAAQNGAAMGELGMGLYDMYKQSQQPTGADIGAAAQQYGPEVAKMGGNVSVPANPGMMSKLATSLRGYFGG